MKNSEKSIKIKKDLIRRTKEFAIKIIKFAASLPRTRQADIIARQLVKAGTSVGANYREANRSRSKAEFISKIGILNKKLMKLCAGLNCLKDLESQTKKVLTT